MKIFKYIGLLQLTLAQDTARLDEYADYYMDGPANNGTEIGDFERGKKKQAKLAEAAYLEQLGLSRTEPPTTIETTTFDGNNAVNVRRGGQKNKNKKKQKYQYTTTTTTTTTSSTTSYTTTTTSTTTATTSTTTTTTSTEAYPTTTSTTTTSTEAPAANPYAPGANQPTTTTSTTTATTSTTGQVQGSLRPVPQANPYGNTGTNTNSQTGDNPTNTQVEAQNAAQNAANNAQQSEQEAQNQQANAQVEANNLAANQDLDGDGIADGQFNKLSCWTCHGKNYAECAQNGREENCRTPQEVCFIELRKRGTQFEQLQMGCKPADVCEGQKSLNFVGGRPSNNQCRPNIKNQHSPSLCRQCCYTINCTGTDQSNFWKPQTIAEWKEDMIDQIPETTLLVTTTTATTTTEGTTSTASTTTASTTSGTTTTATTSANPAAKRG